ncbi:MAG: hypothetical protein AUK47_26590 [Deltaproteobacteria bacterium CG2_30_63_29]|nr:MAG: hypothetical protein AUK47_26590 [Deltaproteobacteria bacterium CG2_30_63_29]PJB41314.1 MAG: hypothetical protein CO108_13260 [Deltaproteobacteria bacterium CG_4_9_14_3_um_filter_63_12]
MELKMRFLIALSLLLVSSLLCSAQVLADSPLTSADFSLAYTDSDWVVRAAEVGLDEKLMEALADPAVGQDERAAIVNALGWSVAGRDNAAAFVGHTARAHEVRVEALTLETLTDQELFATGYLLAMDDTKALVAKCGAPALDELGALGLLEAAAGRNPNSFSVALVLSLVRAQAAMRRDWCEVYRTVFTVIDGFSGARDLRKDGIAIVAETLQLYQGECAHPRPVQGP